MAITVTDINKRFGDFVALEDVNLEVPGGSLTALLGPHHLFRADWRLAVADSVWISRSPHSVRHSVVMDSSESPS